MGNGSTSPCEIVADHQARLECSSALSASAAESAGSQPTTHGGVPLRKLSKTPQDVVHVCMDVAKLVDILLSAVCVTGSVPGWEQWLEGYFLHAPPATASAVSTPEKRQKGVGHLM